MVDVLGTRLGRYEIRERLGRGGMATVYKGWDTNLDRPVAVKVLHEHLVEDSDFRQRFEREAKLLAGLNHPNIVQIYDFDHMERDGEPVYYMVMAFIAGPTLHHIMQERHEKGERLSLPEIAKVVENVCAALSYAHRQGISHRDVTPSNVLYDDQGRIVLADFGLARLVSGARLTQTGLTTGTPVYMSPEQGMGLPGDARSDVYSLGVILFEMLGGQAPYSGESAYAIIMKHVNAPIPSLPPFKEVSPLSNKALEGMVTRALAKEPEDRYQSADDLLADFEAAVRGELPTAVRPVRTAAVTARLPVSGITPTPRRVNGPLVIGLLAVVLLLIGGTVVALQGHIVFNGPSSGVEVTLAIQPTATHSNAESMVDGDVAFNENFKNPSQDISWLLTSNDPHVSRKVEDGVLRIQNTLMATAITTVIDPNAYSYQGPIIIESDMTISDKSQLPSATGIVFRYVSDDDYYVFAFDGAGRVSIWLRQNGVWTELRHLAQRWTPADGVNGLGKSNHIKLIVDGSHLQGFINGISVIHLTIPSVIDSGGVGVYLASTTNSAEKAPFAQVDVADFSVQLYMPNPLNATPTPEWF